LEVITQLSIEYLETLARKEFTEGRQEQFGGAEIKATLIYRSKAPALP
jgi:hypothetical protein